MATVTGQRIAEEAQLLAEEKWILNALSKIRKQRNSLQIERLQLENMLTISKNGPIKETSAQPTPSISEEAPSSQTQTTSLDDLQVPDVNNQQMSLPTPTVVNTQLLDNGVCNFEELNLNVTTSVFSKYDAFNLQDLEDEEEEEPETDSLNIDINMFMNADPIE